MKIPIATRANAARVKMKAPILPNTLLRRKMNNPDANIMAKIPPIMRPELNRTAVTPSTTPKSLRAFPVQLNCG